MTAFTEFDDFAPIEEGSTLYAMQSPCLWDIGKHGSGWQLELKEGRTFDISVPSWLTWALDPHNRDVLMAARVHDQLLEDGHDKAFASSEFRRALKARGVSTPATWLLFALTLIWTALSDVLSRREKLDKQEIIDQAAHAAIAFIIALALMLRPGMTTGLICGFAIGMVREVTEESERVTVSSFIAALGTWRDLSSWALGGAIAGAIAKLI